MLEIIKSTVRNSFIYGIGNVAIKLVGLVLIPIYTNPEYLSTNDYGALGILEVSSQFLVALLGLALVQALTRWYWDKKFLQNQKSIFFTILFFTIGMSILAVLALAPFSNGLSDLLFKSSDYSYLIVLMLISSAFMVISQVPMSLMKLQSKSGLYSISNIVKLLVTLILTIYLVVFQKRGLNGIFEAQILGNVFFFLMLVGYLKRNIIPRFELKILREMLVFSAPLVLGSVSGILLTIFDRYALNYITNLEDVGIYTLGYKIANSIKILIVTSIQLAISPLLFKMMNKEGNKRFYSKVMTYSSYVVLIVVLAISLFSLEIVKVFTSSQVFWRSSTLIPILSLSVFFGLLKDTSLIGLQITKKTKIIGIVVLIIAILNLGLNIVLIPKYNIMGAAVSTLLSQIIFFIVILIYAQNYYEIPFEIWKISKMLLVGLVLYGISFLATGSELVIRLVVKIILLTSFPFILKWINFYDEIELDTLKNVWKSWKNPGDWKSNLKRYSGKNQD
jgi:O-antigen/teichoic acid export membrane protein